MIAREERQAEEQEKALAEQREKDEEAAFAAELDRREEERRARKAKARAEALAAKKEMEQFRKQEEDGLDKLRREIEEMKARAEHDSAETTTPSSMEVAAEVDATESIKAAVAFKSAEDFPLEKARQEPNVGEANAETLAVRQ